MASWSCGFDICPPLERTPSNRAKYDRFINEILQTYEHADDVRNPKRPGTPKTPITPTTPSFSSLASPLSSPTFHRIAKIVPTGRSAYIRFMVGDLPILPCDSSLCQYFVRFSSKVSNEGTKAAETIIDGVYAIAKKIFGERVKWWHELLEGFDGVGIYDAEYVEEMQKRVVKEMEKLAQLGGEYAYYSDPDEEDEDDEEEDEGDDEEEDEHIVEGSEEGYWFARDSLVVAPLFYKRKGNEGRVWERTRRRVTN